MKLDVRQYHAVSTDGFQPLLRVDVSILKNMTYLAMCHTHFCQLWNNAILHCLPPDIIPVIAGLGRAVATKAAANHSQRYSAAAQALQGCHRRGELRPLKTHKPAFSACSAKHSQQLLCLAHTKVASCTS